MHLMRGSEPQQAVKAAWIDFDASSQEVYRW